MWRMSLFSWLQMKLLFMKEVGDAGSLCILRTEEVWGRKFGVWTGLEGSKTGSNCLSDMALAAGSKSSFSSQKANTLSEFCLQTTWKPVFRESQASKGVRLGSEVCSEWGWGLWCAAGRFHSATVDRAHWKGKPGPLAASLGGSFTHSQGFPAPQPCNQCCWVQVNCWWGKRWEDSFLLSSVISLMPSTFFMFHFMLVLHLFV